MDLRALRYFVSTVETGSISAAAQACHIAQPSVTLAITKLEGELNCKLLVRQSKGCVTTAAGQKMYRMAKDLLAHAQSIQNEFNSPLASRRLTLKVDSNIRVAVLEEFILSLQSVQPTFMLSLISSYDAGAESADLHLTIRHQIDKTDTFYALMKERYVLLIPKTNHLAFKTELLLEDLQGQPLISRIHCENKTLFDQACQAYQLNFVDVAEVETEEWAHSLVGAGLGLCFAPLPHHFQDERFEIRSLESLFQRPIPEREIGLAIKPGEQDRLKHLLPHLFTE